jgi:hypothetical protein
MQKIVDRALAQIELIEKIHSIKILNKKEIVSQIAENTEDKRQVLIICTRLNTWIAGTHSKGDLIIPQEMIQWLIKGEY